MKDYHINVFWSDDDDCSVADIPDFFACSALGASPEEAVREVQVAKDAWIAVACEIDKPIPVPTYRPAIYLAG